jgi:peptidase E
MRQQIIAMGGGGFSMEPENLLLDRYILAQARTADPNSLFRPHRERRPGQLRAAVLRRLHYASLRPRHLSLFRVPTDDLDSYLLESDVIYVGGGNSRNLVVLWREYGLDLLLRRALEGGSVLAG